MSLVSQQSQNARNAVQALAETVLLPLPFLADARQMTGCGTAPGTTAARGGTSKSKRQRSSYYVQPEYLHLRPAKRESQTIRRRDASLIKASCSIGQTRCSDGHYRGPWAWQLAPRPFCEAVPTGNRGFYGPLAVVHARPPYGLAECSISRLFP